MNSSEYDNWPYDSNHSEFAGLVVSCCDAHQSFTFEGDECKDSWLSPTWAAKLHTKTFDSTLGYPGEGHAMPIVPLCDRLTGQELSTVLDALDQVALNGAKPSNEVLDHICRLVCNKTRPEEGSRKGAYGAALWHLQPHLYSKLADVKKITEGADRTLRLYIKAWNETDWSALEELERKSHTADALMDMSSATLDRPVLHANIDLDQWMPLPESLTNTESATKPVEISDPSTSAGVFDRTCECTWCGYEQTGCMLPAAEGSIHCRYCEPQVCCCRCPYPNLDQSSSS